MQKTLTKLSMIALLLGTTACASIVEGKSQSVEVRSEPKGAQCDIVRDGKVISTVDSTPASIFIKKRWADASVTCNKEGFLKTTKNLESGTASWTVGNIFFGLGSVIGFGIDGMTGAINKYPESITVDLPNASPTSVVEPRS